MTHCFLIETPSFTIIKVVKPGRQFVKYGKLMKQSRKEPQPRMLFLFSDFLLYARIILDGAKCRVTEKLKLDGIL